MNEGLKMRKPIFAVVCDLQDVACGECGRKPPGYIRPKLVGPDLCELRWHCSCGALVVTVGVR